MNQERDKVVLKTRTWTISRRAVFPGADGGVDPPEDLLRIRLLCEGSEPSVSIENLHSGWIEDPEVRVESDALSMLVQVLEEIECALDAMEEDE